MLGLEESQMIAMWQWILFISEERRVSGVEGQGIIVLGPQNWAALSTQYVSGSIGDECGK